MNKEQIECFEEFLDRMGYGLNDFDSAYQLLNLIEQYAESKREEIERKAYEAGKETGLNIAYNQATENVLWKKLPETTYDQWKESQKQEQ